MLSFESKLNGFELIKDHVQNKKAFKLNWSIVVENPFIGNLAIYYVFIVSVWMEK